jgi:hypothetical protein
MRPGMNVFELGCFVLCCFVSLLVVGPLVIHFKLGWIGWIVGLPLGFFGCFGFISTLFWLVEVLTVRPEDRLVDNRWLITLPRRIAKAAAGLLLVPVLLWLLVYLLPYWVATHYGEGAFLPRACLMTANLRHAHLRRANLRGACFQHAHLEDADLREADLRGAELRNCNLEGTDLRGADLRGASLAGSTAGGKRWRQPLLTDARYDGQTEWPEGFDPAQHGAMLLR